MAQKHVQLVNIIYKNDLQIFTDTNLISELKEVLNRPKIKKHLNIEVGELIDFHKELCYHHNTSPKYKESPDPKDNFLYDLATQTKSKYVVTGDKKILATNPIIFKFISKAKFEQIVK